MLGGNVNPLIMGAGGGSFSLVAGDGAFTEGAFALVFLLGAPDCDSLGSGRGGCCVCCGISTWILGGGDSFFSLTRLDVLSTAGSFLRLRVLSLSETILAFGGNVFSGAFLLDMIPPIVSSSLWRCFTPFFLQ